MFPMRLAKRILALCAFAGLTLLASAETSAQTTSYRYDPLGRLTSVSTANGSTKYVYDAAGNRTLVQTTAVAPAAPHRYWRIRSDVTALSGYLAITELQMRAITGGSDLTTGKSASASYAFYPASQAINDNPNDFWTTAGTTPPPGGHWLRVDFASPVSVVEIVLTSRIDGYREDPLDLFVEHSDDDVSWTTDWSVTSIPRWTAGLTRTYSKPGYAIPVFYNGPFVTGDTAVGGTLIGNNGYHTGTSTTYRWLADTIPINGAINQTYLVQPSDAGKQLQFEVTAITPVGSTTALSNPVPAGVTGHRYWRVRSSTTGLNGYFAMTELQMRAITGGSDLTTGKSASASYAFYPASQAINDDPNDFWTTAGTTPPPGGHWLAVDLGTTFTITEVVITSRADGYREDPLNLFVEWSDDGTTWTTDWTVATIPAWTAGETRTFTKS